jgi:cysteine sulfinate desulfinase/cysteine desulfurase-like protein
MIPRRQGVRGLSSLVYLDNASTTCPLPEVVEAMQRSLLEACGNSASNHRHGGPASKHAERARQVIADRLHAQPDEIVFTSGGTEANNLALKGALLPGRPWHVITSAIEHPSILEALVDEGEPVGRLADALHQDGHSLVSRQRAERGWRLLIRRE